VTTGRFPDGAFGFWFAESCAAPFESAKLSDSEPTTAVVRKSRRETLINPSLENEC
jgi:hypothetical protein